MTEPLTRPDATPGSGDTASLALRRRMRGLAEIARAMDSGEALERVLEIITLAICRHTDWSMSGVMSVDEARGESVRIAGYDPYADPQISAVGHWPLASSPALEVVREQRTVVITNAQHDPTYPSYREDALARGYHTAVVVPLRASDTLGRPMLLSVQSLTALHVDEEEQVFLETVAHQASVAVRSARRLHSRTRQAEKLRHALARHAELMTRILEDAPLGEIIAAVESLLGWPVAVLDISAARIRAGRSPVPGRLDALAWQAALETRLEVLRDRCVDDDDAPRWEHLDLVEGSEAILDLLLQPLRVDGEPVGAMLVFAGPADLDEVDRLVASSGSFALGVALMRALVRFRSESELRGDLLRELFTGTWRDGDALVARAGYLGLDLRRPARLLLLHQSDTTATGRVALHRALQRLLDRTGGRAPVIAHDDAFVVLLQDEPESEQRAERLAAALCNTCRALGLRRTVLAIGAVARELADYAPAHAGCLRAVRLCDSAGTYGVTRLRDHGATALLLAAAGQPPARELVHAMLGPIVTLPPGQGDAALRTLEVYLDAGGRPAVAARALGLHVSSLRYRIARLETLLERDLSDPETRYALQTALKLHRLLDPGP